MNINNLDFMSMITPAELRAMILRLDIESASLPKFFTVSGYGEGHVYKTMMKACDVAANDTLSPTLIAQIGLEGEIQAVLYSEQEPIFVKRSRRKYETYTVAEFVEAGNIGAMTDIKSLGASSCNGVRIAMHQAEVRNRSHVRGAHMIQFDSFLFWLNELDEEGMVKEADMLFMINEIRRIEGAGSELAKKIVEYTGVGRIEATTTETGEDLMDVVLG